MMKRFSITVNGTAYDVQVEEIAAGAAPVAPSVAAPTPVAVPAAAAPAPAAVSKAAPAGAIKISAPMPGNILDIKVSVGQTVTNNQPLVILEAMKMENEIPATADGTITGIHVSKGESVDTGDLLISMS